LQMAAERGELRDCDNWEVVARKLGTTSRVLRKIRASLGSRAPVLRDEQLDERLAFANTAEGRDAAAAHIDVDVSEWDEEPTRPDLHIEGGVCPERGHWPEALNDNWRAREEPSSSKKLTQQDLPNGSLMLLVTDMHFPIENTPVVRLMVEAAERHRVNRVVLGGDILDMNCLSKHAKESKRTVAHATVLEEVQPARWFFEWAASKPCDYLLGNHEDRLKRFVDENPAFHGSVASNLAKMCELPPGINVLDGEVRIGNLSLVHGHHEFKNGTGGKYPAQRLLEMLPDQSTVAGHVHRESTAKRTTCDEDGIKRTRQAQTLGHMSHEHMHYGYVSRSPNWQTGFAFIRFWWDGDRPRWKLYPIEVLFDRYNRAYFEFGGVLHR